MGNCLTKTKVNSEAQRSNGMRVENGGWRRNVMNRLGLGKLSARVDIMPTEETGDTESTASVDDTGNESPVSITTVVCSRQKPDVNGLEEAGSFLILCYARAELEDENDTGTQCSPLAARRESPYFSSEGTSYEGFENTNSDEEQEIEGETNMTGASFSVSMDTSVSNEFVKGTSNEQMSKNYESYAETTESKSVCMETNTVKPECHFFASNMDSGYKTNEEADKNIAEEIPEEIPVEENDCGTESNMAKSGNIIGTGNVVMDNNFVEQGRKRMFLLKQALQDPEREFKAKKAEDVRVIRGFENHVQMQDKVSNNRDPSRCPDYFVDSEALKESKPSTSKENACLVATDTPSVTSLNRATSSESRQSTVSEELKTRISLTCVEILDQIQTNSKSNRTYNIFVRSAEQDVEPRKILVRATSQQVKEGAVRKFVNSLKNVADPASHFDPYSQQDNKIKTHLNKQSGLVSAEGSPTINWTQKLGTHSDVHFSKVPQFYERPPKRQNAREKLGLRNLQKHNIKVQCKEIERIKVDNEQFPGILPPKLLEHWKRKRQEKKHMN